MDLDDIPEAEFSGAEDPDRGSSAKSSTAPSRSDKISLLFFLVGGFSGIVLALLAFNSYCRSVQNRGTSKVVIELLPAPSAVEPPLGFEARPVFEQPDMETEIGKIGSRENLETVLREMGLVKEFKLATESDAVAWLEERTEIRHLGGYLVEISTHGMGDNKFAAKVANKVVEAYSRRRSQIGMDRATQFLEELALESRGQEMLMEHAQAEMLQLMKGRDIVDLAGTYDHEIVTPLMRKGRDGDVALTAEEAAEVFDERRRMIGALAAKSEFIMHHDILLEMRSKLTRAKIAMKMPKKSTEFHERARVSMPQPGSLFDRQAGQTAIWALPAAIVAALASYFLIVSRWRRRRHRPLPDAYDSYSPPHSAIEPGW